MGDIDAHQHFWRYDKAAFGWIAPDGVLARDLLPADLPAEMDAVGVSATIAVQARGVRAETDWLLALAARTPWIAGVVGWLDLTDPAIADVMADYRAASRLVGCGTSSRTRRTTRSCCATISCAG